MQQIAAAFHSAQLSLASHRRGVEALLSARAAAADVAAWDNQFFQCVACVLPIYKREAAAERVIEFVVRFATQHGGEADVDEAFVEALCLRLLALAGHHDKAVRFRVVQLAGRIMNQMAEEAEVSDDLFEALETAMLARCRDKVPLVRAWALKGLFRLQDPSQPGDAITAELLRLMSEDSAKEVRMAAISTIAPSKHAIRAILLRTRDACAEVRLHALGVLRDKVEMRWLSISQRVHLLDGALRDRTPSVAAACAEMLAGGWLRKGCDNDVLALLHALDAVAPERVALERATHARVAQLALDVLLARDAPTRALVAAASKDWDDESHERQPEAVICLRAYLAYLAAAPGSRPAGDAGAPDAAALEESAPELPRLCDALRRASETCDAATADKSKVAATCVMSQLARAAAHCDLSNEHGRANLEALVTELLKSLSTPDEALAPLCGALEAACVGAASAFQRQVTEVISEVEDPLEEGGAEPTDAAEADARLEREQASMFAQARLGEIKNEVAAKLAEEDYDAAEALKAEAAEVVAQLAQLERAGKEAPEIALAREARCLRLSALLLQAPTIALSEHEVSQLGQRFLPPLQSPEAELRELAIKCLGLHCHASAKIARKYFALFAKAMQHDQPRVQLAALRAVCDLLLMHSPAEVLPGDSREEADVSSPAAAAAVAAEKAVASALANAAEVCVPLVRVEDDCAPEMARMFVPMLEAPTGSLRATAALGLAKLMHAGALRSSSLLAKLLLIYFDGSDSEADPAARRQAAELAQQLSVFFAASGRATGVASALLPAVRSVLSASDGSREATIAVEGLISFVLGLTADADGAVAAAGATTDSTAPVPVPVANVHVQLCVAFCCEALLRLDGSEAKVLPRAFSHMALPATSGPHVDRPLLVALRELLEDLAAGVEDKMAAKGIERAQAHVEAILSCNDDLDRGVDAEQKTMELSGADIFAAFKELRTADAASAAANDALAEAATNQAVTAELSSPRDSRTAGRGDALGKGVPGRRKLAKSKAAGLTPARGAPNSENADANAICV